MARGAGGLRHVGAAAARGARADSCWDVTASDGLQQDSLCNRALGSVVYCCFAACCGANVARELAALDARGAFRGRQEVQVLFTGTKRESSLQKHASGESDFRGEESSAGPGTNWMQTQPRR